MKNQTKETKGYSIPDYILDPFEGLVLIVPFALLVGVPAMLGSAYFNVPLIPEGSSFFPKTGMEFGVTIAVIYMVCLMVGTFQNIVKL